MTIDVTAARRDTPGCGEVVHLNNAGAALMPRPVIDAVLGHLELEARRGGYEAAAAADDAIERTYDAIAALLGCQRDDVAVVENATRAWDMAFYALPFSPGDRILTGRAEYASNAIALLQVARRTGAVVEVVDDDEHGQFDVDDLRRRLDGPGGPVRLISLTYVPTQSGLVNPATEVGVVAREAGVPYLLDACQAVGQLPVDVAALGCDFLSATSRKFLRGPRGMGFLYASAPMRERLEPPFLDLHAATWTGPDEYVVRGDARRFENWETNVAAKIGLGVAVDYACGIGLETIERRVVTLAEQLRRRLAAVAGVTVHDLGVRKCAIVSFGVDGVAPDDVRLAAGGAGVNVSVSRAASARLDLPHRGLVDVVRASVHYYNTEDELLRLVEVVERLTRSR